MGSSLYFVDLNHVLGLNLGHNFKTETLAGYPLSCQYMKLDLEEGEQ